MNDSVELLVKKILEEMVAEKPMAFTPTSPTSSVGVEDYPIAQKHPDWIVVGDNKKFEDITLENVLNGSITSKDLRIKPEILLKQGEIAKAAGREAIEYNFSRAAELTKVPDERVLEIYNALRPYRSSKQELFDIAKELDERYQAKICASFIREAAEHYERRKKLKGDN
ncbi:propanediol dehydratase small subunit [Streptococcus rupicaprae]|uniref:Propanediol dehydratase small subunit n=1 Tax=Streptococcus rupicaprae TaxID=759619 RepID=A0ABV2FF76_9STRE